MQMNRRIRQTYWMAVLITFGERPARVSSMTKGARVKICSTPIETYMTSWHQPCGLPLPSVSCMARRNKPKYTTQKIGQKAIASLAHFSTTSPKLYTKPLPWAVDEPEDFCVNCT